VEGLLLPQGSGQKKANTRFVAATTFNHLSTNPNLDGG
jgi:hypothetical protein